MPILLLSASHETVSNKQVYKYREHEKERGAPEETPFPVLAVTVYSVVVCFFGSLASHKNRPLGWCTVTSLLQVPGTDCYIAKRYS